MILRQQYLKRLKSDLDRWSQRGLVDPAKIPAIIKDAEGTGGGTSLTTILAVLGVVLLGFAAMSFVAANWTEMSKLTKLLMLAFGMWGAVGIAAWRIRVDEEGDELGRALYTEAAILLAVILFGVSIMLIGQMYHIGGEYSDGLMLWLAGTLLTAWLVPSRAALVLAIILAPMWSIAVLTEDPSVLHWQFLIPISFASLLAAGMGWRPAAHLIIVAWGVWFFVTAMWLLDHLDWSLDSVMVLATMVALTIFAKGHISMRLIAPFEDAMIHWGLFAAMAVAFWLPLAAEGLLPDEDSYIWLAALLGAAVLGTGGWAFAQSRLALPDMAVLVASVLVLIAFPYARLAWGDVVDWLFVIAYFAASVWCVSYGTRTHDRFSINLGFAAFGLMALYVYFETVGTLLDTAAFFAIGGLLLIGLSVGLGRIRTRLLARQPKSQAEG